MGSETNINTLDELARLVQRERETLLARWREQVRRLPSAADLDVPTLNDHIPQLLDELAEALRSHSEETIPETLLEGSPPAHGLQRVEDGFDIAEVVAEYNILRGCVHDLAEKNALPLQGRPFHIVNRVLDGAIGLAVQTFAEQRALEVQRRREEYLTFVAHDLRTPLNAIALAARVLEMAVPKHDGGGGVVHVLKALHRNVESLVALVGKILEENTHLETELGVKLQRREFDLWPLVESLVYDLQPVADRTNARLKNEAPDDLLVYADASALRRIFQNLIANAVRYAPGGQVTIGGRELPEAGVVECWVSDDGAGIPPERIDRVFLKGETDPDGDGDGLGLAIVKAFVEAHGGAVTVDSKRGLGATFRFTLPRKPIAPPKH